MDWENPEDTVLGYWSEWDVPCFAKMFEGCNQLTRAPRLPSMNLSEDCYNMMFFRCKNLVIPPDLPADDLKRSCYDSMFGGSGVKISARMGSSNTIMNESCCSQMYNECVNLKYVRALPATKLFSGCYNQMFIGCVNLVQIPYLPAKDLPGEITAYDIDGSEYPLSSCYSYMFANCDSINMQNNSEVNEVYPYLFSINNDGTTGTNVFSYMFYKMNGSQYIENIERGKNYRTNAEIIYPDSF